MNPSRTALPRSSCAFVASLAAVAALAAAGCGQPHGSTNVAAFTRQGSTPTQMQILRTIGIYRTTRDSRRACSLITPRFLRTRFDGRERGCEVIVGEARRVLPRSARVLAVAAGRARVQIHELTATVSIYKMRRLGGVWRIDDIVSP